MSRFTKGELEVMRILWEHGEMKPSEIQEKFPREIKNSALRSYLTILLDKGEITRQRIGRAYCYQARAKKDPVLRSMLHDLVDTFFSGSKEALLCRLIKSEQLSDEELLNLKKLADENAEAPDQRKDQSK